MYDMAKNMMGISKKQDKKKKSAEVKENQNGMDDLFLKLDIYIDQITVIASVMDAEYDGGDFCAGMTVAFEGRQVAQGLFMNAVKTAFKGGEETHTKN